MEKILNKGKNKIVLKRSAIKWIIIYIIFSFSFINIVTLLISLFLMLLFLKQKEVGAIKILNLITLRTIMNPGIAIGILNLQNLKWFIIFMCSSYLIFSYRKLDISTKNKLIPIIYSVILFSLYNICSSLIFSSLPIVAIFKVLSFSVVFLSVLIGVAYTHNKVNWINEMYNMFVILFISSVPFMFLPVGYLRNGHAFQGLVDHPNIFAITICLFVSIILVKVQSQETFSPIKAYFLIGLMLYMIILSESRTAFITCLLLIIIYLILAKVDIRKKIILYNLTGILTITYFFQSGQLFSEIKEFLYKGNESILYSRSLQLGGLMTNFLRNPWFGSGFAVPVTSYRTFSFSSESIVEPGNLILAVLSYSGIFGFILFMLYFFKILLSNKNNFLTVIFLPLATVLVSMGEMVFFSSNNIGIWIYMFLAVYIFYDPYFISKSSK